MEQRPVTFPYLCLMQMPVDAGVFACAERSGVRARLSRARRNELRGADGKTLAQSIAAEALLQAAFARCGEAVPVEWERDARGKPIPLECALAFSLSHTDTAVAVAIDPAPIGIDVETVRALPSRAERLLAPTERAALRLSADPAALFFSLWTAKEARAKQTGEGLAARPDRTEARFCGARGGADWYDVAGGYVAVRRIGDCIAAVTSTKNAFDAGQAPTVDCIAPRFVLY